VHRVVAGKGGGFRAALGAATVSRCNAVVVTAVGTSGRRATLKIPRPACSPARNPGTPPPVPYPSPPTT
jgi:hypothetical protein